LNLPQLSELTGRLLIEFTSYQSLQVDYSLNLPQLPELTGRLLIEFTTITRAYM